VVGQGVVELGAEAGPLEGEGQRAEGPGEEGEDLARGRGRDHEGVDDVDEAVGGAEGGRVEVGAEVDGGLGEGEGRRRQADALGALVEGREGEVGAGGVEAREAVRGEDAGEDVVLEEGEEEFFGRLGVVRGDAGEGEIRGEEEGVVPVLGGVEEGDDGRVVVDESGEARGVGTGGEEVVDGVVRVVVVAVAGVVRIVRVVRRMGVIRVVGVLVVVVVVGIGDV